MVKEMPIPKTIGEFIKVLERYPRDAEIEVFGTEIYDNGSVYESEAFKMRIQSFEPAENEKYPILITIANCIALPKED